MSWLRSLLERLAVLLRPGRMDSELSEEMEHHLAMEIEANRRAGMSEAEARRKALVAFGATEWYRERVREGRVTWQLETLARGLRYGLRTLGKRRAFAVAAMPAAAQIAPDHRIRFLPEAGVRHSPSLGGVHVRHVGCVRLLGIELSHVSVGIKLI